MEQSHMDANNKIKTTFQNSPACTIKALPFLAVPLSYLTLNPCVYHKVKVKHRLNMNRCQSPHICVPPPANRIILQCWISWTPAAIRPPPPHPHLPLQRPSSRATPPAPPRHPTPHPKATGTAASTSQVSHSSTGQTSQSQMKTCIHFAAQIRGQFIRVLSSFLSFYVTLTLKHQCAFLYFLQFLQIQSFH